MSQTVYFILNTANAGWYDDEDDNDEEERSC